MSRRITHAVTYVDTSRPRNPRTTCYVDLDDLPVGSGRVVMTVGSQDVVVDREPDVGREKRFVVRGAIAQFDDDRVPVRRIAAARRAPQ